MAPGAGEAHTPCWPLYSCTFVVRRREWSLTRPGGGDASCCNRPRSRPAGAGSQAPRGQEAQPGCVHLAPAPLAQDPPWRRGVGMQGANDNAALCPSRRETAHSPVSHHLHALPLYRSPQPRQRRRRRRLRTVTTAPAPVTMRAPVARMTTVRTRVVTATARVRTQATSSGAVVLRRPCTGAVPGTLR